jgi:uracil-DNA glycosylase
MLVGEQPGDREDLEGRPFVGPAGALLHSVLKEDAPERSLYVTNAAINACEIWLDDEIETVRPKLIVALGATAVRSLLGPEHGVIENRGKLLSSRFDLPVLVTVHPSSVLRSTSSEERHRERAQFAADLRRGIAAFERVTASGSTS